MNLANSRRARGVARPRYGVLATVPRACRSLRGTHEPNRRYRSEPPTCAVIVPLLRVSEIAYAPSSSGLDTAAPGTEPGNDRAPLMSWLFAAVPEVSDLALRSREETE